MKLITYASPSHREMCERFVIANGERAGFKSCEMFTAEQLCESGKYNSPGFAEQMWLKLRCLAEIPISERICYVDADCLLMPGLHDWCENWLSDRDRLTIGFGNDVAELCMGTIVFEQSAETIQWWRFLYQLAWMTKLHDQAALHGLRENSKQVPVNLDVLPNDVFANWATHGEHSQKTWKGEELIVPDGVLCWHANFCVGIEDKIRMLEIVERVVNKTRLTIARTHA